MLKSWEKAWDDLCHIFTETPPAFVRPSFSWRCAFAEYYCCNALPCSGFCSTLTVVPIQAGETSIVPHIPSYKRSNHTDCEVLRRLVCTSLLSSQIFQCVVFRCSRCTAAAVRICLFRRLKTILVMLFLLRRIRRKETPKR